MISITYNLSEIDQVAQQIIDHNPYKVILLFGEMGAGKTTLVKALSKLLGVTQITSSPTYVLVNTYETSNDECIYHFDAYRLKTENEAYEMGFDEYLDSGNWCFIEWPERMGSILPKQHTKLHIKKIDPQKRLLTIE